MGMFSHGVRPFNPRYAQAALDAMRRGLTLLEHCRREMAADPEHPDSATIRDWVTAYPEFGSAYALARVAQAEYWSDEIRDIIDDGRNDYMQRLRADGKVSTKVDHECVQRSKLRYEARRWLMSKLHPGMYAERIQHQQLGADGRPIDPPSTVTAIDLTAALRNWKPKD